MHYLHTMVRISNLESSLDFYTKMLGLVEVRRWESQTGRFTNIFLAAPHDLTQATERKSPLLELTYNWDPETYTGGRNFGHLCYAVDNIYTFCENLMKNGVVIHRPPKDGRMAFIKSPEGISIELLQNGEPLPLQEPWISMENTGTW